MYHKTMNKKLWVIVGGVLTVAVVMAGIGAIAVYAQSPRLRGRRADQAMARADLISGQPN